MGASPLVGRAAELDVIRRSVAAGAGGRGGMLLLTSDAGIGKSRLLGEAVTAAGRAGLRVLSGRATEGSGAYRAVAGALLPLADDVDAEALPALGPYRSALGRLLPG